MGYTLDCSVCCYSFLLWVRAQSSKFILLASTIGPIDSGIVDLLENEFEKETGIRVRHVGAGTGAALILPEKGMWILSWSMQNPSKKNL